LRENGLGEITNTGWFSALNIARANRLKTNAGAFPYKIMINIERENQKPQIRYAMNQFFEKKR
jgi:hypothetical protein